jgi:hypothetical protein
VKYVSSVASPDAAFDVAYDAVAEAIDAARRDAGRMVKSLPVLSA